METTHYYLLYDEDCPLCGWYTEKFIRYGFLNSDHRIPYSNGTTDSRFHFDIERAKTEIALVSDNDEQVRYGVSSLLFILGRRWKWVEKLGHFPPILLMLKAIYSLISFNRKIILPKKCETACSCQPTFNAFWRLTFMALCYAILFSMLHYFTRFDWPWLFFHFGVVLTVQRLVFLRVAKTDFWDYAGQLAVVNLLLTLVFCLGCYISLQFGYAALLVGISVLGLIMIFAIYIHEKRISQLSLSWWLTLTYATAHLGLLFFEMTQV